MKVVRFFLPVAFLSIFSLSVCLADTGVYACQFVKTAGLQWSSRGWEVKTFINDKPFFLKFEAGKLKEESVQVALGEENVPAMCVINRIKTTKQGCITQLGTTLYFDTETRAGSVAKVFEASMIEMVRGDITLGAFSCQKM